MQPFVIVKNTDLIFDFQNDCIIHANLLALQQSVTEKISRVCRNPHFWPPSCPMMTFSDRVMLPGDVL